MAIKDFFKKKEAPATKTEVEDLIVKSVGKVNDQAASKIDNLHRENKTLEEENKRLLEKNQQLQSDVNALNALVNSLRGDIKRLNNPRNFDEEQTLRSKNVSLMRSWERYQSLLKLAKAGNLGRVRPHKA